MRIKSLLLALVLAAGTPFASLAEAATPPAAQNQKMDRALRKMLNEAKKKTQEAAKAKKEEQKAVAKAEQSKARMEAAVAKKAAREADKASKAAARETRKVEAAAAKLAKARTAAEKKAAHEAEKAAKAAEREAKAAEAKAAREAAKAEKKAARAAEKARRAAQKNGEPEPDTSSITTEGTDEEVDQEIADTTAKAAKDENDEATAAEKAQAAAQEAEIAYAQVTRVIVRADDATKLTTGQFQRLGGTVYRKFMYFPGYAVEMSLESLELLVQEDNVAGISEDSPTNRTAYDDIALVTGATAAAETYGGSGAGIGVAVIDSGKRYRQRPGSPVVSAGKSGLHHVPGFFAVRSIRSRNPRRGHHRR